MVTLEQLCGGGRGERRGGEIDGDVSQWYIASVNCWLGLCVMRWMSMSRGYRWNSVS